MASRYTCIDGDMADAICVAIYGDETDFTEAVLAANPGLADIGPTFPAGTVVILPDLAPIGDTGAPVIVRLWD